MGKGPIVPPGTSGSGAGLFYGGWGPAEVFSLDPNANLPLGMEPK